MSGNAFDKALDRGLKRRSNPLEMLRLDLDAIFDTGNFNNCQAAGLGQIFEAVTSRQARLLNTISNVQDVDNLLLGVIEMIER